MDKDILNLQSLLQTARMEHDSGNFQHAYSKFIKVQAVAVHTLNSHVHFRDNGVLESTPENYAQLFAYAQEALRRAKDILDSAKSRSAKASSMSKQNAPSSASSMTKTSRPGLAPSLSSQRSLTSASRIGKRTKRNIPMIPISPLTRLSLLNNYVLSQVTLRLEQAKQTPKDHNSGGSNGLAVFRRLIEDVRIQQAKVDAVNLQIQSVANSTITSWDPDTIAKQLTIIDMSLFKDMAIPRDLVRSDRHQSPAQFCVDFENYLAHSVAHLLLQEWDQTHPQATNGSSSTLSSKNSNSSHAVANPIAHVIRVAYILLHVYRNFNAFMAIMRALTFPEVKRMHKLWSGIPSKSKDHFRKLMSIYRDHGEPQGYKSMLVGKLDTFQDVGKDAMVAIPWMRYHQDEVTSIVNSYDTGNEAMGGQGDVVLSSPGARKLASVSALLTQCKMNDEGNLDRAELNERIVHAGSHKSREPVHIDGIKAPLTPVWDLVSLASGDISLQHWLLSRPYLNKQQLIDESLAIEPLSHGEELPCYDTLLGAGNLNEFVTEDESADAAQDDAFEHVVAPEHDLETGSPRGSGTRSALENAPVTEADIDDIMDELLNDDDGLDDDSLFGDDGDDDVTTGVLQNRNTTEGVGSKEDILASYRERSRDVLQFLGIESDGSSGGEEDDLLSTAPSQQSKGKMRATSEEENAEIDQLMSHVKQLVQDSEGSRQELVQRYDALMGNTDSGINNSMNLYENSTGTTQEQLSKTSGEGSIDTERSSTPKTTIPSLESLRMQLEQLDQAQDDDVVVTSSSALEPSEPASSPCVAEDAVEGNESDKHAAVPDAVQTVTLQELDMTSLDSSTQSSKPWVSASPSLSATVTVKDQDTTLMMNSDTTTTPDKENLSVHEAALPARDDTTGEEETQRSTHVRASFDGESSSCEVKDTEQSKVADWTGTENTGNGETGLLGSNSMPISRAVTETISISRVSSRDDSFVTALERVESGRNEDENQPLGDTSPEAPQGIESTPGASPTTLETATTTTTTAAAAEVEEGPVPRAARQRRRIAGGVISLPTSSKTLHAKTSTTSLSSAAHSTTTTTLLRHADLVEADSVVSTTITDLSKDSDDRGTIATSIKVQGLDTETDAQNEGSSSEDRAASTAAPSVKADVTEDEENSKSARLLSTDAELEGGGGGGEVIRNLEQEAEQQGSESKETS